MKDVFLEELAVVLHDEVLKKIATVRNTIFLCGKTLEDNNSVRRKIAGALESWWWYGTAFDVLYPEPIFEDLLTGPDHKDLLTLENILAQTVDVIVVIPESPGSIAELGAFANHEILRNKLVCVTEKKYRTDKSFINLGPIRLLRDMKMGRVVEVDSAKMSEIEITRRVVKAIRKVTDGNSESTSNILNMMNVDSFILALIYLIEPCSVKLLSRVISYANKEFDLNDAEAVAMAGLSKLAKDGSVSRVNRGLDFASYGIEYVDHGYQLSPTGLAAARSLHTRGWGRNYFNPAILDKMRVRVLNRICRGKLKSVG